MCSVCKDILVGFEIEHDILLCPFRASLYCSRCACYGHSLKRCPSKERRLLTVTDTEEAMKEFLVSNGIKPGKNIKRALQEYAEAHRMQIVYLV